MALPTEEALLEELTAIKKLMVYSYCVTSF